MVHVLGILMLAVPVAAAWSFINRVRGAAQEQYPRWPAKKTTSLLLMGCASLVPVMAAWRGYHEWGWEALGVAVWHMAGVQMVFRPSWGEIFPQANDTYMKGFAPGVRPLTNRLAGYVYDSDIALDDVREIFWKVSAWVARFGIYGTPLALSVCYVTTSILPLTVWWIGSLWVGWAYLRAFLNQKNEDPVATAERLSAAIMGFLITISCMS